MAGPDRAFWQERFETGQTGWDRGGPHPQLAAWLDAGGFPPAHALRCQAAAVAMSSPCWHARGWRSPAWTTRPGGGRNRPGEAGRRASPRPRRASRRAGLAAGSAAGSALAQAPGGGCWRCSCRRAAKSPSMARSSARLPLRHQRDAGALPASALEMAGAALHAAAA
ncbi:hypothetical protein Ddc_23147 [Ditylenchus destructor]|nr:hypothetical protein Ddc_23147 [Ditylenchus destructor]